MRERIEVGEEIAMDANSASLVLAELGRTEAERERLQETCERVRYFLQEDDAASAWRAVRTIEEAIAETECRACRAHLTALAADRDKAGV